MGPDHNARLIAPDRAAMRLAPVALAALALTACEALDDATFEGGGPTPIRWTAKASARAAPAYWLWSGVPDARVPFAETVYVHAGMVAPDGDGLRFEPRGRGVRAIHAAQIVLVLRMTGRGAPRALVDLAHAEIERWRRHDNVVVGIQLDYDAPTAALGTWGDTLDAVRAGLDPALRLSVTGLVDWIESGRPATLARAARHVDEMVFQLYRDHDYHRPLDRHAVALRRLDFRFKVGLLAGHEDNGRLLASLDAVPGFDGVVYFVHAGGG